MTPLGAFLLGIVIGSGVATFICYKMMKTIYHYVKAQEMTISTANNTINYVGNIAKKVKKWRKK